MVGTPEDYRGIAKPIREQPPVADPKENASVNRPDARDRRRKPLPGQQKLPPSSGRISERSSSGGFQPS